MTSEFTKGHPQDHGEEAPMEAMRSHHSPELDWQSKGAVDGNQPWLELLLSGETEPDKIHVFL